MVAPLMPTPARRALPDQPPAWAARYISIPFSDRGRAREPGVDCWGLVRLVYAERFGVLLPSYDERYLSTGDRAAIAEIFAEEGGPRGAWTTIEPGRQRLGDLAVFAIGRRERHVGIVIDAQRMLHCHQGVDSCLEPINGSAWGERFRRFLTYSGDVVVRSVVEPFCGARARTVLPPGLTIAELLEASGVAASPFLRVYIGDVEVPPDRWDHIRPRAGRTVTVAAVPRGGGGSKNVIRIVAIIAIAVAAAAIAPQAAGLLLGQGASAGALTVVGAGVAAGITIAGTLAVNALIRPPGARLTEAGGTDPGTSPTLAGSRNSARPYQVIPRVLGSFRFAPPYGAAPYTEIVGADQYLRMLFVVKGPVEISDIRLGPTPIEQFEGVEIEIRNGFDNEAPCSLFPSQVHEDGVQTVLTQAGSWQQRTTQTNASEISVDVTFPAGLVEFDSAGNRLPRTVAVQVQYRKVGDAAWLDVNGNASSTAGSPTDFRQMDLLFRSPEAQLIAQGVHNADVSFSGTGALPGAKPAYLPTDQYSWSVEGFFRVIYEALYEFAVDSSDAADVHVDGAPAAEWYGLHAPMGVAGVPNFTPAPGKVNRLVALKPGFHHIRCRMENRSAGGGAIAVGIRQQGQPAWSVLGPANLLRVYSSGVGGDGLRYSAFTTASYLSTITATEATSGPVRRNLAWAVAPGQYEVRIRRLTPDSTSSSVSDIAQWTALRTIEAKDPITIPNIAKIALRIKASGQLSGVVDDLNALFTSILPDYDAAQFGTWVQRGTANPASHIRAILQGNSNKRPLPDNRIHLADLAAFHTECVAHGFTFNGVIDFAGTVRERLADVAAAGRATMGMRDGLHTVVRDVPQQVPVQHFTPRNSSGFQGVKVFTEIPHALRCRFPNAAADYEQDERIVLNDGYQIDGLDAFGNARPDLPPATRFELFEMFGVTDPTQIFKLARYHLAVATLRPETFTVGTDFEHLACSRGDLVLLSHDVMLVGLGAGRVLARITNAGGDVVGLVLDEPAVMEAGKDYGIRVRLEDGVSFARPLVTAPGSSPQVMFTSPVAPGEPCPDEGDLFSFGEVGRETSSVLVKSIAVGQDLSATLSFVDYAPGVYQADQGEIPPFDSNITVGTSYSQRPDAPIIETIRSDESVMIRDSDGSLRNRMLITLRPVSGRSIVPTHAQAMTRPQGSQSWTTHPTVPIDGTAGGAVSIEQVEQGVTYELKVRVISKLGAASAWTAAVHTVVGKSTPPPDVVSFNVARLSDGEREYSWDLGDAPPDIAGVRIRYGAVGAPWAQLLPLHGDVVQASPWLSPSPPSGTWRFGIKAVDTSGNESLNAIYVERTLGAPPLDGVAFYEDAALAGWPGTKTDCHRAEAGNILEADDHATWGTLAAYGVTKWSDWTRWCISPKSPIAYEHTALDAGVVLDFSPEVLSTADGAATIEVAWSIDGAAYTNWLDIAAARGRSVNARYLKARISVAATAAFPIPVVRQLVVVMRAKTVVQEIQDFNTATADSAHLVGVGDVRIPVAAGAFRLIRTVALSFNNLGPGWSWQLLDKDATLGPRVKIYNADHQPAHALVDAVVRGL